MIALRYFPQPNLGLRKIEVHLCVGARMTKSFSMEWAKAVVRNRVAVLLGSVSFILIKIVHGVAGVEVTY